jgi:hypothetical protein
MLQILKHSNKVEFGARQEYGINMVKVETRVQQVQL